MNIADLKSIYHKGSEEELDNAIETFCEQYSSYNEFCEANREEVPLLRCNYMRILELIILIMYDKEKIFKN